MKNPVLHEPLLHFAAIGALLFAVNALFQSDETNRGEIVVSQSRLDHLAAVFEQRWQRPPTPQELQRLVEDHIREEVLYREALALGLDRNDAVIRRRLRMKMELLTGDLLDAVEPREAVLRTYFTNHAADYRQPARFTFRQIYFSDDARTSAADDARAALPRLRAGAPREDFGDGNPLQERYRDEPAGRIDRVFGRGFAARLGALPTGRWAGPVESAYGQHLVRIERATPEQTADFTAVRPQVLRDWQVDEKKRILQAQYDALRNNYRVRVDAELPAQADRMAQQ